MPDPIKKPESNADDTFAAAFAQIAELDSAPSPEPSAPAAPAAPAATAATATAEPAAPAATATAEPAAPAVLAEPASLPTAEEVAAQAAADATKVVAPAPAAEPAAPAISDDELVRRLGGLLKTTPAAPAEQQTQQQQEPVAPFTPEEVEFLTAYEKDFPDVARAESLRRRAEYQALVGYVFQEVTREFRPVVEQLRTLTERTHLGDLQVAVPDYATTRQAVIDWAAKQPAYLQPAYNHVIQNGTVDEVADLINRFRAETGAAAPAAAATTTAAPAAPALAPAVARAAAALAPVPSKRTATTAAPDPVDFDSAFAQAAALVDKL